MHTKQYLIFLICFTSLPVFAELSLRKAYQHEEKEWVDRSNRRHFNFLRSMLAKHGRKQLPLVLVQKKVITSFKAVLPHGMQHAIIQLLAKKQSKIGIVRQLNQTAQQVIARAQDHNYYVAPELDWRIQSAIKALTQSLNAKEFTFHLAAVEHLVHDIQMQTVQFVQQPMPLIERSPALLAHAVSKYYEYLAPTENELSLLVDTARYICDVTVGTDYLSAEVRQQRLDQFWHMLDGLSIDNLSKMTAEQWIDNSCYVAARATYALGASAAFSVLKNVKNIGGAFSGAAGAFAQRFVHAFDQVIGAHPAVITSEGAVVWNASPAAVAEARQTILAFEGMKDKQSDKKLPDIVDSAQKVVEKEKVLDPIKICEKDVKHIFRNEEGHLPDTMLNRKILIEVASDIRNFLGCDKYGTEWFAKIMENGKQVWVGVRQNAIRYGGMNEIPKVFNPQTGLSRLL